MICQDCVRKDAELETARELAYEAVEARDIGRAALRLMEQQLEEMRKRALKAEANANLYREAYDEHRAALMAVYKGPA